MKKSFRLVNDAREEEKKSLRLALDIVSRLRVCRAIR